MIKEIFDSESGTTILKNPPTRRVFAFGSLYKNKLGSITPSGLKHSRIINKHPPLAKHSSVHITSLLSHTYLLAERRQCAYGGKSSPAHGSACGNLV